MRRIGCRVWVAGVVIAGAGAARAAEQVWNDAGADNVWSADAPNWDAGAVWVNGNSALFAGGGGLGATVEVANAVSVADLTFQANGYVVADADNDGTLTLVGAPSVITVANAGDTGTVSEVVAGGAGFAKAGNGVLELTGTTNTFTGVLRVSSGMMRLSRGAIQALGAGGAGNETIVENGATLNFNGAYTNNFATGESLRISGAGVDGLGALVNTGAGFMNGGFGTLTLLGNATIGCLTRIDLRNPVAGNGYTLTKSGGSELAVGTAVTNCAVVINAGNYTYMNNSALGANDFDTTLNGGGLRAYGTYTLTERLIMNGGSLISAGPANAAFTIAGRVTLNGTAGVMAENGTSLDLSGLLEGAGGIARSGVGAVYVTGTSNTYSGATLINAPLYVGRTNLYAGTLGSGVVTNSSTVYCYSGRLGSGTIVNNGNLYFDATNAFACSNAFFGSGATAIRYGGQMTLSGSVSSNATFRIAAGALTLTNNARLCAYSRFFVADRSSGAGFPVDPTNVTASLNVSSGASLETYVIEMGNGNPVTGGGMTGTVTQAGGTVRTFGWSGDPGNFPGEYDGLRLGHYSQAYGTYNMRGGTLVVDNGYRLCIATDGRGWFRQTGGQVFSSLTVVNSRTGGGGYGRLTVEGGVFNVGSNGIVVGAGAPYLVEYGGMGGIVRASTNFVSPLNAELYGADADAITFDTADFAVSLSGSLTGAGGLNKTGSGTLLLSGANTYSGATRVLEGALTPASGDALPAGGVVAFGVAADGSSGRLHAPGDLSLAGLSVAVANPELLDTGKHYIVATYGGELSGAFGTDALPEPWYVYYDWENKRVELRAAIGTLIRLR